MQTSRIIIATATTNSADDSYGRIKIKSQGVWEESNLVMVLNGVPICKDDTVLVDISCGFENPIVLGLCKGDVSDYDALLFHTDNNNDTTKAWVKGNVLHIENSDGVEVEINGSDVKITLGSGGQFSVAGSNLTVDA